MVLSSNLYVGHLTEKFQSQVREKTGKRTTEENTEIVYSGLFFYYYYYYMTSSYRPGLKKFDWFKAGL